MLQTFQYQNSPITFSKDGEVMVNATQMAKPFGKNATHFLRNEQTLAFMSALADRVANSQLVKVEHGGNNPGTWMHQKLALKFAGWLSPEFELWVYDRIEELLTTGKTELLPVSKEALWLEALNSLTREVEIQKQQFQLAQTTIKQQAPMVAYYNDVLSAENGHLASHMAQMFGLHANTFNKLLREWGILDKVGGDYKLKGKYMATHRDCVYIRPVPITNSLGKTITKNELRWTEKARPFLIEEFGKRGYTIKATA